MNKKKVVVTVTNDLATDQRVKRTIGVLQDLGYDVCFVGRLLPTSMDVNINCETVRFKLWFNKGFLFYANYNLRLFFFLLFKKFDIYLSNDLDTLLPNHIISKFKRKTLVYDSHEYFTGVPEIQNRPFVKAVWKTVERITVPYLKHFITVNESIADLYQKDYGLKPYVVRNISDSSLPEKVKTRQELNLPEDKYILINQGSGINVDRGMEELLEALPHLDNTVLVLVGKGDVYDDLRQRAKSLDIEDRIIFVPPQPYLEMLQYTLNADCGVSLDKPNNLNYKYSLPNKLFDYIKCSLPVLVSSVIEVKTIVQTYAIGEIIKDHDTPSIVEGILKLQKSGKEAYKNGLSKAASENYWDKESEVWRKVLAHYRT